MQPQERIAALAYERFLARGGEHGHDVEDWLAAEAEVASAPHRIVLVTPGPNTIELVRLLREITGASLTSVRALVEATPAEITCGRFADIDDARRSLEALGARVDVRPARG
jgi:ribosomal protein L7/L12